MNRWVEKPVATLIRAGGFSEKVVARVLAVLRRPEDEAEEDLISARDAAGALGVSVRTLYAGLASGRYHLAARRFSRRRVRYSREEVRREYERTVVGSVGHNADFAQTGAARSVA